MRHIIIGDVHGCLGEMLDLFDQLHLRLSDRIVFAGDLIHKGPDSVGVVRRVRALCQSYDVHAVVGNHEDKLLRYWRHLREGRLDVAEAMYKRKPELQTLTEALDGADATFLQSMPLYCRVMRGLVVHGGIPPSLWQLPLQHEYENARGDEKRLYSQMIRLRRLTPSGDFVATGDDTEGTEFWAERYRGTFGLVFFGHEPFMEPHPVVFRHAIGLDLGCCYGGRLAAAVLDEEKHGIRFVSVPARRAYAKYRHGEDD